MIDKNRKCVLITGGSRGIGRAICEEYSKNNYDIVFTYANNDKIAEQTKLELDSNNCEVFSFKCDSRKREHLRELSRFIELKWGKLDVLINNAGINKPTDFDQINDDDWDEVLSVNLKGPFVTTQELIPLLKKSKSSSIINICSVSGQYGGPRTAHYAASKAGLISLGQVIARFGAKYNIRCNNIAAGLINSEMGEEGLKSSVVSKAAENIVMGRLGTFEEVAKVAFFLGSDDSSYITAQTINVNGGLYF